MSREAGSEPAGRPARYTAFVGEATHAVEIVPLGGGRFRISIDGRAREVDSRPTSTGTFSLLIDNATAEVSVVARGDEFAVAVDGRTHRLRLLEAGNDPGGAGTLDALDLGELTRRQGTVALDACEGRELGGAEIGASLLA